MGAPAGLRYWRSRADRLMFARRRVKMTASRHWMASPACLHKAETGACRGLVFRTDNALPRLLRWRKNGRRVRYLYHHFPGPRSVYFPAVAQRFRSTDRPRAAALRSIFGPRRRAQLGRREEGGHAAAARFRRRIAPRRGRAAFGRALEGYRRERIDRGRRARCDRGRGFEL